MPPPEPDVLLMVTLYREESNDQLAGPIMVKTKPSHTIERIMHCVCRWAKVPPAQCMLVFEKLGLEKAQTVS